MGCARCPCTDRDKCKPRAQFQPLCPFSFPVNISKAQYLCSAVQGRNINQNAPGQQLSVPARPLLPGPPLPHRCHPHSQGLALNSGPMCRCGCRGKGQQDEPRAQQLSCESRVKTLPPSQHCNSWKADFGGRSEAESVSAPHSLLF